MTEDQRVMNIADAAEEVLNSAVETSQEGRHYVVVVPKKEWNALIDAVHDDSDEEEDEPPVSFVDAVYYGENFNRAED